MGQRTHIWGLGPKYGSNDPFLDLHILSHIADLPSPHIALSLGKVWRGLGKAWRGLGKAWPGELFWSSFRGVLLEFLGVLVEFLLAEGSHIADLPSPHIALSIGKVWRGLGEAWRGPLTYRKYASFSYFDLSIFN